MASQSGNLTAAAQTVVLTATVGDQNLIQISGTYSGVTVASECSPDGTNWTFIQMCQIGPVPGQGIHQIALPANQTFVAIVGDLPPGNQLRIRCVAITSGTAAVVINSN